MRNNNKFNGKKRAVVGGIFLRAKENGVNLEEIAERNDLRTVFSKKAADMAANFSDSVEIGGRVDYTDQLVVTIDGEDSRDFDDAVAIEKLTDGYILYVHIADVAHYVKEGSAIDKEAVRRGTSVYFPFGAIPMLPSRLCDDLCSLKPKVNRLTLSLKMHIDKKGNVKSSSLTEGVIKSKARLTYEIAQEMIDFDAIYNNETRFDDLLVNSLKNMAELARILMKKREKNGAIDLDSRECEFIFSGNKVADVKEKTRLFSHKLIEEFMILANITIAKKISKKTPFLFRVHDAPTPEKAERLANFLAARGIDFVFDTVPTTADLKSILESVDEKMRKVLSMMVLRTMSKAVYAPRLKGHFGLNLTHYCHFTSPIRRYPDLFVHRVLKLLIRNEAVRARRNMEELAEDCSKRERLAEDASRKVDDILKAKCMSTHIGEEFDGIISGVTDFGVFVTIPNTAEGLVRLENLDGHYAFDSTSLSLIGKNTYRFGDPLRVKIVAARYGKVEMNIVEEAKPKKKSLIK